MEHKYCPHCKNILLKTIDKPYGLLSSNGDLENPSFDLTRILPVIVSMCEKCSYIDLALDERRVSK